jgi:anaerobic selenocysteine-containing dehydrogenase
MIHMRIVPTVCPRDCYDTCFVKAKIENGMITSVAADSVNPVTQTFTCPRGKNDHKNVYSNRILFPSIRKKDKPSNNFGRIAWNSAIEIIAKKIKTTVDNLGSDKILFLDYGGNTGLATRQLPSRVWYVLGATFTDYALCSRSGHEAIGLHYGLSYGLQPEELMNMKFIVYWGFNAVYSSPHMWALSTNAQKRYNATIAVIDPRKSESAKKADLWIQPKYGTDVILSFGVMRYLIEQNYLDSQFINNKTDGYEFLKEAVLKWKPEKIETLTDVKWNQIEQLGELYGECKPNATMIGIGIQKNHNGAEMVRAISLIPALIGLSRNFYYSNDLANFIDYNYLTGEMFTRKKINIVNQVSLSEQINDGDFTFIFVNCMNPLVTLPNQKLVRNGLLENEIFLVVYDTHWTKSTEYADLVLPAPTFLEKDDLIVPWSHNYIRKSCEAIDPLGESKEEYWFMQKLSRALGLTESWLYEDKWSAIQRSMTRALNEGTWDDLLAGKTLKLKLKDKDEYQTPSHKIEFYSRKAVELGLDPLPTHNPIELRQGEFILLNSALPKYTHTQFQAIFGKIPSNVSINPKDANRLNIKDQDMIYLYNDLGKIQVKSIYSNDIPRGVLWAPREFEGTNNEALNILSTSKPQKLGMGPKFNSTVVKLEVKR